MFSQRRCEVVLERVPSLVQMLDHHTVSGYTAACLDNKTRDAHSRYTLPCVEMMVAHLIGCR